MFRVALVGCGKIADAHASIIQMIKNSRIVGVCDQEDLMAHQFSERFIVDRIYNNLEDLLAEAYPDVVHITTPPQSHYAIARKCLEYGCHLYIEKPFTVSATEAEEIISLATERRLKITVGHDDQFTPAARRMRKLVNDGYLGDPIVHMESYYCYEMTGAYASALLGDKNHWVRNLPGQLLQNIISHGLARIAEYLNSDSPEVTACGYTSPFLLSLGENEIIDELRVIITEYKNRTAYFTFSSEMRPSLHQFRIFGSNNGLVLDHDNQTLICLRGKRYVSYLEKFIPSMNIAGQYISNFFHNARLFLARNFHTKEGMRWLIESFYESIREGKPLPIPYREIILVSRIMDRIFEKLRENMGRVS